ncbi:MAG: hypothetical protein HOP15_10060 [Planctomycetes bacterium]|nr:hypothetical protein [Planctomycetota bacterium]
MERSLAALFAALVLGVWPAAFWHEATTVHEVCAKHGELVDVSGPEDAPSEGAGEGPLWGEPEEHEGQHEHCPFVTLGQPSPPAPAVRDVGVRLDEAAAVPPQWSQARRGSVPILRLAPKQSPPV